MKPGQTVRLSLVGRRMLCYGARLSSSAWSKKWYTDHFNMFAKAIGEVKSITTYGTVRIRWNSRYRDHVYDPSHLEVVE